MVGLLRQAIKGWDELFMHKGPKFFFSGFQGAPEWDQRDEIVLLRTQNTAAHVQKCAFWVNAFVWLNVCKVHKADFIPGTLI